MAADSPHTHTFWDTLVFNVLNHDIEKENKY